MLFATVTLLILFTFLSIKFSEPVKDFEENLISKLHCDARNCEDAERMRAQLYNTAAVRDANFIIIRLLT